MADVSNLTFKPVVQIVLDTQNMVYNKDISMAMLANIFEEFRQGEGNHTIRQHLTGYKIDGLEAYLSSKSISGKHYFCIENEEDNAFAFEVVYMGPQKDIIITEMEVLDFWGKIHG